MLPPDQVPSFGSPLLQLMSPLTFTQEFVTFNQFGG